MKGATSPPTLAHTDPAPMPIVLTQVGNISAENTYMIEKAPEIHILPVIAKDILNQFIPEITKQSAGIYTQYTVDIDYAYLHFVITMVKLAFKNKIIIFYSP